jgi:hypothetical protein
LVVFSSWWLVHSEAVVGLGGTSVAVVGLGAVAASILRGMGLPLGLWPGGPPREVVRPVVVIVPALLIALVFVTSDPSRDQTLAELADLGTYLLVAAGVVAWGFGVALVQGRTFAGWFGAAVALAVAPTLATLPFAAVESVSTPDVCWTTILESSTGSGCLVTFSRSSLFLAAVLIPASLVSFELAFRRMMLGIDGTAGAAAVVVAAGVATAWAAIVGGSVGLVTVPWWLMAGTAVAAGCLYLLSNSVLVSATYTGLVLATVSAARFATMDPDAVLHGLGPVGTTTMVHALVGAGLLAVVARRNGFLAGLR